MRTFNDGLDDILNGFSKSLPVEKPCRITRVNSQYSVDVEYYDNSGVDNLYNVPVKHIQTQSAYVFLGLKSGDCGTIRFFDSDVGDYYGGTTQKIPETRCHDINDNLFSVGFYPAQSQYVAAKEREKYANQSYVLTDEQFRVGMKNTVELLSAYNEYVSSRQEVLQAKYMALLNMELLDIYQGKYMENEK